MNLIDLELVEKGFMTFSLDLDKRTEEHSITPEGIQIIRMLLESPEYKNKFIEMANNMNISTEMLKHKLERIYGKD